MKTTNNPKDKISLPVVFFEEGDLNELRSGTVSRAITDRKPAKKTVVKDMLLDIEAISKLGMRKWDEKKDFSKDENWTVLFDKLKQGENIIIAVPMDELREKFVSLGIINVLS